MTTIQETIDYLHALHSTIPPSPWVDKPCWNGEDQLRWEIEDAEGAVVYSKVDEPCARQSYELLARLRNALPALLEEIERLTAENKALTAELAKATGAPHDRA